MPTGDGLLARVHPPLGILSAAQLRAVAEGARRYGNGHIDITARGNLQIRGVSNETACALAAHLTDTRLGDVRADGGPQRLTMTSPLADCDPDALIDAIALAREIEAVGLTIAGLPAKMLVAIESGGQWGLGASEADLLIRPTGRDRVAIGLATDAEALWMPEVALDEVPALLGRMLNAFVTTEHRRMRDLDSEEQATICAVCSEPARASPSPLGGRGEKVGTREAETTTAILDVGLAHLPAVTAVVVEAPFGRCDTSGFELLAQTAAPAEGGLETSASRGFVIVFSEPKEARVALDALATAGFITDPADPRRAVAACPGAPACASGTTPVQDHAASLAKAFAPFAARGLTAHVSGCGKGCAHPRPADLTLVAEDGRYRAALDGAPGDAQQAPCLTFEAALDRVRRADPARSLAGAFPS
ncbi:precorrin-3B synthase [Methylobacterium sp. C25]|uniref:precorrin-3B synthase n=1 Tax=Methylobacterium sp. C25 TaxID=2721622 RepID=UPI001F1FE1BC|nr:precorrin-3B synthase [Methylobacterium sp. C25]MCE4222250.1 precorrin-3B synthase [Methylobacterium sp. C25]